MRPCVCTYNHVTTEGLGFTGQRRHMTPSSVNFTSKMADNSESVASTEETYFRHGYYMLISTIVSFQLLNFLIYRLGSPKSVREDPWRWRNLFISWTHAFICGTWDILCFVLYPELTVDPILFKNYFLFMMVPFSTGYFVYDTIDMLLNNKLLKQWEVTLHHIAVASMFWFNFHTGICIAFNTIALMAEINSFFLHSRKLLQMAGWGFNHPLYRTVSLLNLVTFAICRGYSNSKILYGMYYQRSRVPQFYFMCLSFSMSAMTGINLVLFWRLLKTDLLNMPNKRKMAKLNGNNNLHDKKTD